MNIRRFCLLLFAFVLCFSPLLMAAPSFAAEPSIDPVAESSAPSLYDSAYALFHEHIYGFDSELTPDQTLTLTLLSTLAALFVVGLPFLVVFLVLRFIFFR